MPENGARREAAIPFVGCTLCRAVLSCKTHCLKKTPPQTLQYFASNQIFSHHQKNKLTDL
jgi:hypothetical protein